MAHTISFFHYNLKSYSSSLKQEIILTELFSHSMPTYISILRGINVSGSKLLKMAELKGMLEKLGFEDVVTYIQSGNAIFKTSKKDLPEKISETIAKAIQKKFGFDVPVITTSAGELKKVIDNNPFIKRKGIQPDKLHVTFLGTLPESSLVTVVEKFDFFPDEFMISGREIYIHCPGGYGNTRLSNNFFENKLKVRATTRNWNTVNKLWEMAKEI
jgi:uncharacterized protein (DUF1697 family)